MTYLSERERIIQGGIRRRRSEHWQFIRRLIIERREQYWLEFWQEHWPPDKHSCMYALGQRCNSELVWNIRLGLHYLRMSEERQIERECVFEKRRRT